MNDKTKKVLSRLYATALILLAALMTLASMSPMITVDSSDLEYKSGRFTDYAMTMESEEIGIPWMVKLLMEFEDFSTVFSIESNDARLRNLPDEINQAQEYLSAYVNNYTDYTPVEQTRRYKDLKEDVDRLVKEQEDTKKDNEERLANLTEEDTARILDKLQNDPDFAGLFAGLRSLGGIMVSMSEVQTDDPMDSLAFILATLLIFAIVLFGVLFPVLTAIIFLVKLIQYFINLGKADVDKTEKRMSGFPFAVYPVVMFILFFFFFFILDTKGFEVGSSLYLTALVWLVSTLVRAIKAIVIAKKNRARVICKQVLSLVAAVLVVLMFANFNGMFMVEDIRENSELLYSTYHSELVAQGMANAEAMDKASTAGIVTEVLFAMLIPLFVTIMIVEVVLLLGRFRYKTVKNKHGVSDLNLSHLGMAIVLTLLVIVPPVVFNAPTYDDKIESFKKGMYKSCYTEYEESGTPANAEYESLKQQQELGTDFVDGLKQAIEDAPEEEKEAMNLELGRAERELEQIEKDIEEIETRKSKSVTCIVMGALFILIEVLYIVIPKLIKTKNDEQDPEPAAEAPAEEVPAAEAPAEEVPAEEVPAEEVPAEEVPAEEVPAEEVPAEPVQE